MPDSSDDPKPMNQQSDRKETIFSSLAIQPIRLRAALTIGLLTAATLVVALAAAWQERQKVGIIDADSYAAYGFRIAEGRGLVDPQGRPTAFRGPTYPLICAGLALVFGPRLEVIQTAQCLFYALANGLIGLLAYRYGARLGMVVLAMLGVMFFWPAWPWFCHIFTEPLFTLLLALILWAWTEAVRAPSAGKYFWTGLVWRLVRFVGQKYI